MAWTASGIFRSLIVDTFSGAAGFIHDLDAPAQLYKVALFQSAASPDKTVASASSGYGTGTWATNESTGTNWSAGGVALGTSSGSATVMGTVTFAGASNVATFDATDTASTSGTTLTTAAHGALVYNNAMLNKQGVCFNYFGGGNQVTNGTLTIVWNASGIFTITV